MRNFLQIIILLSVFSSCNADFLITEPTEQFSEDQIKKSLELNPDLLEANIRGLYSLMIEVGSGRSFYRNRDDFGQKSYDIFSDLLCGDIAITNTVNYDAIVNYDATKNNSLDDSRQIWTYYYRLIKNSNQIIDILESVEQTSVPKVKRKRENLLGQAKAIRAYAYFYLLTFYTNYNESAKILPLYTNGKQINQPQKRTKEIFDFIVNDLNEAIAYLEGFERSNKNQINQNVAKGILAYIYGARGDYQKVFTLTNEILFTKKIIQLDSIKILEGFNDINLNSWMWGVDISKSNNLSRASFWGQMDVFHDGDAFLGEVKSIDDRLFKKIKEQDIRKKQFNADSSKYFLAPLKKFFDNSRIEGGVGVTSNDYVFMRVSEMILLNAEAAAMNGDEAKAKEILKQFLTQRLPASELGYLDDLAGQTLKDEIYLQTRIEFWGEGKSYLAMKRNKATITRGNNHLYFKNKSFDYDNSLLIFKIPAEELTNNPNIN